MRSKKHISFRIGSKKVRRVSLRHAITTPEVFIIMLMIAIMAAISAPRINQAKASGRLNDMVSSLETVRQQIELYTVQHKGLLPGQKTEGGEITQADFIEALTKSDGTYGPYLKKIPRNPFNGLDSVRIGTVKLGSATGSGWYFNSKTGDFRADDLEYHRAY